MFRYARRTSCLNKLGHTTAGYTAWQTEKTQEVDNISTPYGNLLVRLELELVEGGTWKWPICNPMALLYHMCEENLAFARLLQRSQRGSGVFRVCLYADEETPGNNQHPDVPKESQCFYWTFHELPDWFRASKAGWWYLGVMKTSAQDQTKGGQSGITAAILKQFWAEVGHNMRNGVRIPLGNGEVFLLQAEMGASLQDFGGIKYTWSIKGASGRNCCPWCNNIQNCDPAEIAGDPYLKHVATALPGEFELKSDMDFWLDCDKLHAEFVRWQAKLTTKGAFQKLEKQVGIKYDPHSLGYDKYLRKIIGINNACPDWMHSLLASGGLGQYHLNAFVLELLEQYPQMTLEALDDFAAEITWRRNSRQPRNFFVNRFMLTGGSHLKAFAGEVILATRALTFFVDKVLLPRGLMPEHCSCLKMLQRIIEMLLTGDSVVSRAAELHAAIVEHHKKALSLYGEDIMKIKPHLMMHVPKKLQEHGANSHCFHGERKHIKTKGISESCNGLGFHLAVLRKGIAHDLAAMSRSRCVEIYLHEPVAEMPALAPFMKHFFGEGPYNDIPKASRSIGTKLCNIYHSEVVLFTSHVGPSIGVCQFFASCIGPLGAEFHAACLRECVQAASDEWVMTENVIFLDAASLREVLPCAQSAGRLVPLFRQSCNLNVACRGSGDARTPFSPRCTCLDV